MMLIYHDETKPLTYEQVYKGCQQGYGIERPDKVSGFMGFFFRLPDIYAYGRVENWAKNHKGTLDALKEFITRFYYEDYGFVTASEYSNNVENRWLCGTASWCIGRYSFDEDRGMYGGVVLEFFRDYGVIYSIEEDVSELYAKEHNNPNYKHELEYHSYKELQDMMKNRRN